MYPCPWSNLNQNSFISLISKEVKHKTIGNKTFPMWFLVSAFSTVGCSIKYSSDHSRKYGTVSLLCPMNVWAAKNDLVWKCSMYYLFKELTRSAYCNFRMKGKCYILCLNIFFNCFYPHMLWLNKLFTFIVSLILL